ncbi:MAG: hypothetical protein ACERKZ_02020 [Lachnotalea sp.]
MKYSILFMQTSRPNISKRKKIKQRTILGTILSITLIMASTLTVFAASGSYTSTYDMTGGVFSRYIQPKSKVTVSINPTQGSPDVKMGVIWAKKTALGWDGPLKYTSSVAAGSVSFDSSEKRKVWLRDFAGVQ